MCSKLGNLQLLVVHDVFTAALCKVLLEMCLHAGHPELQLLSKLLDAAHLDTADMTVLAASAFTTQWSREACFWLYVRLHAHSSTAAAHALLAGYFSGHGIAASATGVPAQT